MTIALISHPACGRHEMGAAHPESPARLAAVEDQLLATGLDFALRRYDAPAATRAQLSRAHDAAYVERILDLAPAEELIWLDSDTAMNAHSLEAALRAAGAGVLAVDLVLTGETSCVFCNVRPPGHHAERDRL